MKYMNLNNSVNRRKESEKRINYISTRIKSLENDINEIKNKENITFFSPNHNYISYKKTKNKKIIKDYEPKPKNIYENNNKEYYSNLLFSSYNPENYEYKNLPNKLYEKKIFKKKSNYNNIIHEKKKFFLNNNSQMNRKIEINNYINKDKKIYNIRASDNNNLNRLKQFLFFSKSFNKDDEINNESKLEKYNIKHMEKLEYEFELRRLKKKLYSLEEKNKQINEEIDKIKNKNENMEKDIFQNENEDNLLNNIILLNKQYMADSRVNSENEFNQNNISKFSFENIILNIMDLKFDYDNNLLINEFIDGVNNLLNISLPNQNNENNNQNNNILAKINQLIDLKNNLYNSINKYDYLLKENNKYKNYFTSLINNLNLNNIYELDEFIKKMYIKNIKENNHMRKITETLINETILSKPKKEIKNHFYSFNKLVNSASQSIDNNDNMEDYKLQNFLMNKHSDSRINQKRVDFYLINRARKLRNNLNKKNFNKTEEIDRNQSHNKNSFYQKRSNISLNYSEKYSTYNNRNKKKKKININLFNQRNNNFYKIKNKSNINGNQNNLFNTEEDINDIKYYNINEVKNKQENNNNLDKKFVGHVRNHSVIIFNK